MGASQAKFYYEYDLFLPVGAKKAKRPEIKVLGEVRKELVRFFGGLTESFQRNEGLWKIGPLTVRDEIQIWHVMSDKGAAGDRFLKGIRKKLERELREELVLIIRHKVNQI